MTAKSFLPRPHPPECMAEIWVPQFAPSPELRQWVCEQYLADDGLLRNPDHAHLRRAKIGFLWTNVPNARQMRAAEIPGGQGSTWAKARAGYQLTQWFGASPDFLITLDAGYGAECDDLHFAALVDHELYHCGQARDQYGCPRFTKEGNPVFGLRGHDVEEFVGVVRRFGVGAAADGAAALVAAAGEEPEIARIQVSEACGDGRQSLLAGAGD